MKDILVSLFLVGSVAAGASETAGMTNFMEGENPLGAAVRQLVPSDAPFASVGAARATVSSMVIAHTEGTGVRARSECSPDSPGSGAIAEGASVVVVRIGGVECPGWALVSADGVESWVRMNYLNAAVRSRPSASASSSGQSTGKSQGGAGVSAGGNTDPSNGNSGRSGRASTNASGNAFGPGSVLPTALPSVGAGVGLTGGQGWGQGIGGGQDHQSSGIVGPGNSGSAANSSASTGNGQGWGQGIGGGQDHQSSTATAPGNSAGAGTSSNAPK